MILNLVKTLLGSLFPLITFPYITRVLGPEGIGIVNYSLSIVGYFALISGFGILTYAIREVSKVRDDRAVSSKLSIEIFQANIVTTLVAYILFFVVVNSVDSFQMYKDVLYVCSLTMLLTTIGMEWLYVANEDYLYITVRTIIVNVLSFGLLFVIVRTKEDVFNYALLTILSSVGVNVCNFFHSRKYIDWGIGFHLSFIKHFKYFLIFFVTALTATLHTILDQSMLGYISGPKSVGIYVTAVKIGNIITALICAITATMFPRLSYLVKNDNSSEWKQLLTKTIDLLLLISIPVVVLLMVLGKQSVILLAGSEFIESIPVLYIMNFMIIIVVFTNIIGNQLFMAINKERWTLVSVIAGVVLNVILNAVLIPYFDAKGAAISSVLSEGLVLLVQIVLLAKLFPLGPSVKAGLIYIANALIMGGGILCFLHIFKGNEFFQIIFSVFIGGVIYISMLLIEKNSLVKDTLTLLVNKLAIIQRR